MLIYVNKREKMKHFFFIYVNFMSIYIDITVRQTDGRTSISNL